MKLLVTINSKEDEIN